MATFDPLVHPDLSARMARVFLGAGKDIAPKVNFLWSLGSGDEARGYGKSAYLIWMADAINSNLGASFLKMCGAPTTNSDKVVAVYTSFSTVDSLSLSGVLYAASRDLLCIHQGLLQRLRAEWVATEDDGVELYSRAAKLASRATERTDRGLLWQLVSGEPTGWRQFFDYHSIWHRQRWGRRLFGTVTAFLRAVGITRILLLIDQVEDFAGSWLSWRHYRDFWRIADMCVDDALFRDTLQIVLTQHPGAQFVLECCWVTKKLGELPLPTDEARCIIIPPLTHDGLVRLVKGYLSSVRVTPEEGVRPFTRRALNRLCELSGGRPGSAIQGLYLLTEIAVDKAATVIDIDLVEELLS